jgi:Tfp pilus assembly protein PilN
MIYYKTSVGIELRGEDILISSLQGNFSGGAFTYFKRIANYRLSDRETLKGEIIQFFKSNGLTRDRVVLGIPRKDIILRYLDLPLEVADNLKQVIQYQVQSFEPSEENSYYYDYVLLSSNAATKKLMVLLAMVRKSFLDEQLQMLREIGIKPVAVLGSSIGLANLFLQNPKDLKDKTFILADMGSTAFELIAVRNGEFAYSRETIKEDNRSWSDLILSEVGEAVSRMRLGPDSTLERVVIAGESSESALPEIKASIPECELLKDSIGLTMTNETQAHIQEASSALGLAYTGMVRRPFMKMNLLPSALRVRQTGWAYVLPVLCGFAIIGLLFVLAFHKTFANGERLEVMKTKVDKLKPKIKDIQALGNQVEAMEKQVKTFEDFMSKKDMNIEVLREMTQVLPLDTYLTQYVNKNGIIQLNGISGSSVTLIEKLDRSPYFKNVIPKAPFREQSPGKDIFNIEAQLEK